MQSGVEVNAFKLANEIQLFLDEKNLEVTEEYDQVLSALRQPGLYSLKRLKSACNNLEKLLEKLSFTQINLFKNVIKDEITKGEKRQRQERFATSNPYSEDNFIDINIGAIAISKILKEFSRVILKKWDASKNELFDELNRAVIQLRGCLEKQSPFPQEAIELINKNLAEINETDVETELERVFAKLQAEINVRNYPLSQVSEYEEFLQKDIEASNIKKQKRSVSPDRIHPEEFLSGGPNKAITELVEQLNSLTQNADNKKSTGVTFDPNPDFVFTETLMGTEGFVQEEALNRRDGKQTSKKFGSYENLFLEWNLDLELAALTAILESNERKNNVNNSNISNNNSNQTRSHEDEDSFDQDGYTSSPGW